MSQIPTPPSDNPVGYNLSNLFSRKSKIRPAVEFLEENYGNNLERFFKTTDNVFDFALSVKDGKHQKMSKALKFLKYGIPAVMMGAEFGFRLKNFISERKIAKSMHDKHMETIGKKIDVDNVGLINTIYPDFGMSLLLWIVNNPKTDEIKILGYYDVDSGEDLNYNKSYEEFSAYILIEYKKFKFMWKVKTKKSFLDVCYLDTSIIYHSCETPYQISDNIQSAVIVEYIKSFDIKKNVLFYDSGKISARKREVVKKTINQINTKDLINQIEMILKNNGRRGIAFIGMQGTGKSLIVRKVEEIMTNHTILHITPERLSTRVIDETFLIIRNLQPLIVVFEDFDSFEFGEKDDKVGKFINLMDTAKNTVFLVTINDPSMIHKTIIDRPQRFDDIIEIKPPVDNDEIYTVMRSNFDSFKGLSKLKFPSKSKINKKIYDKCMKNKFTQAAISSAMDKALMLLNNGKVTTVKMFNDTLFTSLVSLEKTQETLSRYKFSNKIRHDSDEPGLLKAAY